MSVTPSKIVCVGRNYAKHSQELIFGGIGILLRCMGSVKTFAHVVIEVNVAWLQALKREIELDSHE